MNGRESSAGRVIRMLGEGRPDKVISRETGWPQTAIDSMKTLLEHERFGEVRDGR